MTYDDLKKENYLILESSTHEGVFVGLIDYPNFKIIIFLRFRVCLRLFYVTMSFLCWKLYRIYHICCKCDVADLIRFGILNMDFFVNFILITPKYHFKFLYIPHTEIDMYTSNVLIYRELLAKMPFGAHVHYTHETRSISMGKEAATRIFQFFS